MFSDNGSNLLDRCAVVVQLLSVIQARCPSCGRSSCVGPETPSTWRICHRSCRRTVSPRCGWSGVCSGRSSWWRSSCRSHICTASRPCASWCEPPGASSCWSASRTQSSSRVCLCSRPRCHCCGGGGGGGGGGRGGRARRGPAGRLWGWQGTRWNL